MFEGDIGTKGPIQYCNRKELPALQGSENQNEQLTSDVNAHSLTSTPTVHQGPSGYASLSSNEPSLPTPYVDLSGSQSYHQHELPPEV